MIASAAWSDSLNIWLLQICFVHVQQPGFLVQRPYTLRYILSSFAQFVTQDICFRSEVGSGLDKRSGDSGVSRRVDVWRGVVQVFHRCCIMSFESFHVFEAELSS